MLIVCDFDGTATEVEPLAYLAERFAPGSLQQYHDLVGTSIGTLREVLHAGVREAGLTPGEIIQVAIEGVPLRKGFKSFCDSVKASEHRMVIVSAGFQQLIEPLLAAGGVSDIAIIANELTYSDAGLDARFRDLPICDECGEPCKRGDLAQLREDDDFVVLIGDGYSDMCLSSNVDKVFATGLLADRLAIDGIHHTAFTHFDEVSIALELTPASA